MRIYPHFILCGVAAICAVAGSESAKSEPEPTPPAADATPEKAEAKLGKWDGFRGVAWLEPPDNSKGIGYGIQFKDGRVYHRRAGDKMRIGEADIDRIQYVYLKRRFCEVSVFAEGKENGLALIRATEAQFGKPSEKDPVTEGRIWKGKSSSGDTVWVRIDTDILMSETRLTMFHMDSLKAVSASLDSDLKRLVEDDF